MTCAGWQVQSLKSVFDPAENLLRKSVYDLPHKGGRERCNEQNDDNLGYKRQGNFLHLR